MFEDESHELSGIDTLMGVADAYEKVWVSGVFRREINYNGEIVEKKAVFGAYSREEKVKRCGSTYYACQDNQPPSKREFKLR